MRRTSIVLLALVLLVTAPVVGTVAAQEGNATTTPTENSTSETSEPVEFDPSNGLTLAELQRNGPRQANSPDGVRMGEQTAFWAVYWPASNPFASPGSVDGGEYLAPGHTLGRNSVYLRTWTYEDRPETVKVAYWRKGSRTVQRGNTTTTEPVAENVTVETHEVTFDRGRPTVEIPLRRHDQRTQVTMWIAGEDYARWTFAHKSIPTTQAANIDSQGDYLASVISDYLVWILLGCVVVGWAIKKAIDRAGDGPGYGYAPWFIGLSLLTGMTALFLYQWTASLLVNAKYVLWLGMVGVIAIVMLETYTNGVTKALFLRPTMTHTQSPKGKETYDILDGEVEEHRIVQTGDGVSIVKPGFMRFLARVFGRNAKIENIEQLQTRVELNDSKWDELFLVDPEADEILFYSPEGWTTDFPAFNRDNAPEYILVFGGLATAVAAILTGTISGTTPTLALFAAVAGGLAWWALEPVDGVAAVDAAPVHLRTAFGALLRYAEDVSDAKHFEDVKEQLDTERISKEQDVDEKVRQHDRTLIEEMLDQNGNVPAAIDAGDEDGEIDKQQRTNGAVGNAEASSDD